MIQPSEFHPIPFALCERIRQHAAALAEARTPDEALAALFLCHCELKEAEKMIPQKEPAT